MCGGGVVVRVRKSGRPKKYIGSDRVFKGIYIPYELAKELEREAKELGVSFNHYINLLLASANKELTKEMIEYYKELHNKIDRASKEIKSAIEPTIIVKKIEHVELPRELEKNEELQIAIKRAKQQLKSGEKHINQILDWLVPTFESIALKNGYVPESKSKVRMYLISRLVRD